MQPIRLHSAAVHVDVAGRLARTTIELELLNPNARQLEGSLEFPLQPGQQIAAFALDIGGQMREAVPVPKDQGRQVFESVERRRVDPGLLEQTAGNQFRLRVYPIPANGTRRVRLAIDEVLRREGGMGRLDIPVQLLAGAEAFALRVSARGLRAAPETTGTFDGLRFARAGDGWDAQVQRAAFRAATPIGLRFPIADAPAAYATTTATGERYVLAEVPLHPAAPAPRTMPHAVGLLWDASASARKRDRAAEFALLDRYFARMGEGRVVLRFLRDVGEDGGRFDIHGGDWSALRNALDRAVLDGASDLGDWSADPAIEEYLLVSDGLRTYGTKELPRLSPTQRLYAIDTAGAASDTVRLGKLAQQRNGRLVAWQGTQGLEAATHALLDEGVRIVGLAPHGVTDLEVPSRFVEDGVLRVAGRVTDPDAYVDFTLSDNGVRKTVRAAMPASDATHPQVGGVWAGWKIAGLSVDPEANRAEIARIGQQFGVVTPGTSLIVLDAVEDYVRYDIAPPPALREEVARLQAQQREERAQTRSERLDQVASEFDARIAWWKTKFPKKETRRDAGCPECDVAAPAAAPPPAPAPVAANAPEVSAVESTTILTAEQAQALEVRRDAARVDAREAADAAAAASDRDAAAASQRSAAPPQGLLAPGVERKANPAATITLQPWQPDSPYARRLRAAQPDALYALYLDERDSHADSTAFYLDVADLLLEKGRRAEALRVLSNLAELRLENRHVLRVLGYRLMQAKDYGRAVEVFRTVLALADEEPQSHRDLGLALAATGQRQEAITHLYDVVARTWDSRFSEVELVALNELNAIAATSPGPLDLAFVDRRLRRNLPLDLRVALSWDSDNSDMDLWVTDPDGEKCYYAHTLTRQGGLISDDFTGGYGPEEFVLRNARPGRYKVEAHYFGDRQQIVTGATTLTLSLSTGWGTKAQRDQRVTLRLDGKDDTVFVGEFDVK